MRCSSHHALLIPPCATHPVMRCSSHLALTISLLPACHVLSLLVMGGPCSICTILAHNVPSLLRSHGLCSVSSVSAHHAPSLLTWHHPRSPCAVPACYALSLLIILRHGSLYVCVVSAHYIYALSLLTISVFVLLALSLLSVRYPWSLGTIPGAMLCMAVFLHCTHAVMSALSIRWCCYCVVVFRHQPSVQCGTTSILW